MSRNLRILALGLALCLFLIPAHFGRSEATSGIIEDTVCGQSQAVPPGVTATLRHTAAELERLLVT